jgi:hypothetical protein
MKEIMLKATLPLPLHSVPTDGSVEIVI